MHPQILEEVYLEQIREAEVRYAARHGGKPFDLSHWNAGASFADVIRPHLSIKADQNAFDYIYSSEMPELGTIAELLNVNAEECCVCLAPAGTSAQLLVSFVLRALGVRRVHLVGPHYFAARYALEGTGLEVVRMPLGRSSDRLVMEGIPTIAIPGEEAIWWTDPIFTFGTDCDSLSRAKLCHAAGTGTWVVSDQSLARPGIGLHQSLIPRDRVLSIHCPHKAICVNGLKFAAVAFPAHLEDIVWQWADVVFGGLSMSNLAAAHHFLTPAFSEAVRAAEERASTTRAFCAGLAKTFRSATWSGAVAGVFGSFFFDRLAPDFVDSPESLESILGATGASFITGSRNAVPPAVGFSFRINVARDGPQFRGALIRLLKYLDAIVS